MADKIVSQVIELYRKAASMPYEGEPVSELEHALQCAEFAHEDGAQDALVAAALLHDIGHVLQNGNMGTTAAQDNEHEKVGKKFLEKHFVETVAGPVGMHVGAKRWLVHSDPRYAINLSGPCLHSLKLQGGPFNSAGAREFLAQPYAKDALLLRLWDDRARVAGAKTRDIDHYGSLLEGLLK